MTSIRALSLAVVLAVGLPSASFAVTGRDENGNPNGTPGSQTAPNQASMTDQTAPHGNGQVPPGGTTVGPASGNRDTGLGYGKGGGENSPVGKR
jgi:hypothetical protein